MFDKVLNMPVDATLISSLKYLAKLNKFCSDTPRIKSVLSSDAGQFTGVTTEEGDENVHKLCSNSSN